MAGLKPSVDASRQANITKYKGAYDGGFEAVRQARYERQKKLGLVDPKTSPRPPMEFGRKASKWDDLAPDERRKEAMRMEIYAAMVDRVDQNIGRLLKRLEEQGKLDNTLIMFLSDNGACAENPKVAPVDPKAPMGSVASFERARPKTSGLTFYLGEALQPWGAAGIGWRRDAPAAALGNLRNESRCGVISCPAETSGRLGTRRGRAETLQPWGMNYSYLRELVRHLVTLICLAVLSGIQPALSTAAATRKVAAKAAADADPIGVAVAPGKEYVYKQSGGVPQKLEVYFPPNRTASGPKVPGVILFHGGGWSGGDLTQFRHVCRYLASRGLVAATANYRMLTKAERDKLPAGETNKRVCVTDAKSAIRWFKQHAAELGVDSQRIITGGGSAGGHVAVLATLNPGLNDPADPKDFNTRVAAYLLFNPAFRAADSADPAVDVLQHLGAGMAPAIFFFGTEDRTWKPGSDALLEKLLARGGSAAELWLGAGQAHGFFNRPPWQDVTLAEADRFLVRLRFLQGAGTLTPPVSGEKLVRAP